MWWLSFLAIIWVVWKERNHRCFEGASLLVAELVERARFIVALWASILSTFSGLSLDMIVLNWREVATAQQGYYCFHCFVSFVALGQGPFLMPFHFVMPFHFDPQLCWLFSLLGGFSVYLFSFGVLGISLLYCFSF